MALLLLLALPSVYALGPLMTTAGVNLFGQSSPAKSSLLATPLTTSTACENAAVSMQNSDAYPAFQQAVIDWQAAANACLTSGVNSNCDASCDDSSCSVDCSDSISDDLKSACDALGLDVKLCEIDGKATNPDTQCTVKLDGFGVACLPKACQNDDDEDEMLQTFASTACTGGLSDCSTSFDCGDFPIWAIALIAGGGALVLIGVVCWCRQKQSTTNNIAGQNYNIMPAV